MPTAPGKTHFPAAELLTRVLPIDCEDHVKENFMAMVREVLKLSPDCLAKVRGDGAYIFVPPKRQDEVEKNLLTLWLRKASMSIDIRPTDGREPFIAADIPDYVKRLGERAGKLIG